MVIDKTSLSKKKEHGISPVLSALCGKMHRVNRSFQTYYRGFKPEVPQTAGAAAPVGSRRMTPDPSEQKLL
jgi:hypothetical protein